MGHRVELITDRTCPHVQAARDQLRRALRMAGAPAEWQEWDRDDPEAPGRVRSFGSPTILVNGRDVAGADTEAAANCCRVYAEVDGLQGVPSVETILAALTART